MRVPKLHVPSSYQRAKKLIQIKHTTNRVTTACYKKCVANPTKRVIPEFMFVAESFIMPASAPVTSRILPATEAANHHIAIKYVPTVATKTKEADSRFCHIQEMVKSVLPSTSDKFINEILETSDRVNCNPEDLTALMYVESKFNPNAKRGSFVGLGQMNQQALNLSVKYAKEHNSDSAVMKHCITPSAFRTMSREQQMPYVRNFILAIRETYVPDSTKKLTGGELYGLFYTPSRINEKFLTSAHHSQTAAYYRSNEPLDYNNDKTITKDDLQQYLDSIKRTFLVPEK